VSDASPEARILDAAIEVINEDGLQGATVRKIAERAGVNPAAISYYYRGKDKLLERAMAETLKNAFDFADFADLGVAQPKERLTHIVTHLTEGALRYPGIARAHLFAPILEGDYAVPMVARFNAFLDDLAGDLAARYPAGAEPAELRDALVAVFAATVLYFAATPELMRGFGGPDPADPEALRRYVARTVARLLP
jgi:AcrR family transcriptional regulator